MKDFDADFTLEMREQANDLAAGRDTCTCAPSLCAETRGGKSSYLAAASFGEYRWTPAMQPV
ncbi:MAG TPA: hypothetical protein VMS31_01675 [Pyrinomonadaceae bacterium]|nr:hypothetical protein [Pyrinomonadaceae bacterium]